MDALVSKRLSLQPDQQDTSFFVDGLSQKVDGQTGWKMPSDLILQHTRAAGAALGDTASGTTAWCLYEMSEHPAVEEQVMEELKRVWPDEAVPPTYAQVAEMKY